MMAVPPRRGNAVLTPDLFARHRAGVHQRLAAIAREETVWCGRLAWVLKTWVALTALGFIASMLVIFNLRPDIGMPVGYAVAAAGLGLWLVIGKAFTAKRALRNEYFAYSRVAMDLAELEIMLADPNRSKPVDDEAFKVFGRLIMLNFQRGI